MKYRQKNGSTIHHVIKSQTNNRGAKRLISLGIINLGYLVTLITALITALTVINGANQTLIDAKETRMRSESDSAVSKLANESAAERMAGVNSLVALADDWGSDSDLQSHEYHQKTCAYALLTYLKTKPTMKNASSMTDDEAIIRDSIQKGFSDHLQVDKAATSWDEIPLSFSGSYFYNFNLSDVSFKETALFDNCTFYGNETSFNHTKFLQDGIFTGSTFYNNVDFTGSL